MRLTISITNWSIRRMLNRKSVMSTSQAKQRNLLDHNPDPIGHLDAFTGKFIATNGAVSIGIVFLRIYEWFEDFFLEPFLFIYLEGMQAVFKFDWNRYFRTGS